MTKLGALRSHLDALRRRRLRLQLSTAWSGFAVVTLWTLLAAFVVDRTFMMNRPQRFVALLLVAGGITWAWRRLARPLLGGRETEIDVALLIEGRQAINSDLVAALQFESPEAEAWGSRDLREAIIERAAKFGNTWDLPPDPVPRDLARRAAALGVTGLLLLTGLLVFPRHATTFLNRLCLGSAHYPGNTAIHQVLVNGNPVTGARVRTPYGEAIRFEIHASGELPDQGYALLRPIGERTESRLLLIRDARDATLFSGILPAVVNPLRYQVYIGDAWTDPTTVQLIPLPVIETRLTPTAPAYTATGERRSQSRSGALELSITEGSRVDLEVTCRNKALKDVTLTIAGTPYALKSAKRAGERHALWTLETDPTPLARVSEPLLYEIQVTDDDDMRLPQPLRGSLRIKSDHIPVVTASSALRYVLPDATVPITYRVADDYGIQKLQIHMAVAGTNRTADVRESRAARRITTPVLGDRLPLSGITTQNLSSLKLVKGDRVQIKLEAVDYRGGDTQGRSATSDPFVLLVTDEAGILAEIAEPDARTATVIDNIIGKQLGISNATRKESSP